MEKMIYLVWKHENESPEQFRSKLLGEVSEALLSKGVHGLRINVDDEDVAPAARLRILATKPPISGMVSLWVDTAIRRRPLEDILANATARMAGYLVTESEPLVNTKHVVPAGHRTPGMAQVALLRRPPRLAYEQWIDIWHGSHTKVAIETQSTFGYRQNVIARPLTYVAPPYDAIVEEGFPEGAMTDPMVFYDAGGDEAKLKERQDRMTRSVQSFLDFGKIDCIPTSEYVIKA